MFVGDTGLVSAARRPGARHCVVSEPTVAPHVKQEPIGTNAFGWFTSTAFALPRRVVHPADLAIPFDRDAAARTPACDGDAMVRRRRRAPRRVSTCNSISATRLDDPAWHRHRYPAGARDAGRGRRSAWAHPVAPPMPGAPGFDLLPDQRVRARPQGARRPHARAGREAQALRLRAVPREGAIT